jgi:lipoprotein-anchoring transpeptidase ErfK/SrfK
MSIRLQVSLRQQQLYLYTEAGVRSYPVSTARAGAGEREGSGCTPRGRHYIRACIGGGAPVGAVFVGRRPTGEVYTPELAKHYPGRDWILTRILWLCGLEPGFNRGGRVDTQRRYIYIHGTPDTEPMGIPLSHGCIRMRNDDLLDLYEQVSPGTEILIEE